MRLPFVPAFCAQILAPLYLLQAGRSHEVFSSHSTLAEIVLSHLTGLATGFEELNSADHALLEHLELHLSDPLALIGEDLPTGLLIARMQALLVLHKFHPRPRGFSSRLWPRLVENFGGNATSAGELALAMLSLANRQVAEQLTQSYPGRKHHVWHNHVIFSDWLLFCQTKGLLSPSDAGTRYGATSAASAAAAEATDPQSRELDQAFFDSCSGATRWRKDELYCKQQLGLLNLARLEEAAPAGRVMVLRSIVSQSESRRLIRLAYAFASVSGRLDRASIADAQGRMNRKTSHLRLAGFLRLRESENPLVSKIIRRIALVVGLSDRIREDLQIINYALAGYYQAHYDAFLALSNETRTAGDRLATAVIYLSSVPTGGHTVFPLIGARIQPIRGDVVFWHNLDSDGQLDPLTYHGSCPVVYGSKWIATLWFREKFRAK